MKRLIVVYLVVLSLFARQGIAQIPESFNYQAAVRNAAGELVVNQEISIRLSILEGSETSSAIYTETHSVESNSYGMISLKVGEGNPLGVAFGDINWTSDAKFIKVEADITGNTNYQHIGTSELMSVPFSRYAKDADVSVFADSSRVSNTSIYSNVSGYSDSSRVARSSAHSDTATIAMSLGSSKVYSTNTDTLFVVKDNLGQPVFAVFPDGVKVIIDQTAKGNVGGFAVSGRNPGKASDINIFSVTPDSTRVYVNNAAKGNVGGFAVSGRNPGKGIVEDIFTVNSDSTRIYIDESAKGNVGGFAVSGRNPGKSGSNDYFNVSGVGAGGLDTIKPSEARMLWYPKSEAFLVGRVLIEDADSVGLNSMATGFESKAIGNYSQALGYQSIARGNYSSAIGYQAISNNTNAFAFGNYAKALGVNSFALGENAEALSSESYSFGRGAKSYGYRSFAFGSSGVDSSGTSTGVTKAKGDYSFAIGQGSVTGLDLEDCPAKPIKFLGTQEEYWQLYYAGHGAVAVGVGDSALANYSTAIGYYNAAGYGSVALGFENKAYGSKAAILGGYLNVISSSASVIGGGYFHTVDGTYAGVFSGNRNTVHSSAPWGFIGGGYRNEVYGSTASVLNGTYNIATGTLSSVLSGSHNNAYSWCETVVGQYNDYNVSGDPNAWVGTDHLFVIGNGTDETARSNAMVVLKNGEVYFPNVYTHAVGATNLDLYIDNDGKIGYLSSSKRYKKNISTMENVSWIYDLKPVNYTYKNDVNEKKQYGLIAEDVEIVNREFVSYNENNELETVQYSKLITPMLKAIQDQRETIITLENQNKELLERIKRLEELIVK